MVARWVVRCRDCDVRAEVRSRATAESLAAAHRRASDHETTVHRR